MDYRFSELHGAEMFHSKVGLTGQQIIVENYDDCTITHRFDIGNVVKADGDTCLYTIKNHTTVIDKSEAIKSQLKEQSDAICELAELIGG